MHLQSNTEYKRLFDRNKTHRATLCEYGVLDVSNMKSSCDSSALKIIMGLGGDIGPDQLKNGRNSSQIKEIRGDSVRQQVLGEATVELLSYSSL